MKLVITRQIVTTSAACVATALLAGAGCEDASARQRAEIQETIAEASHNLELAAFSAWAPGDPSAGEHRKRLDAIAQSLRQVKAEGGQQVAASLLASAANGELARISLAQAELLEAQNRELYQTLHSNIDAAMRLKGLAEGIEGVSTQELRSMLAAERTKAEERLRSHSRRLAELDGPIAERESENQQDAREASRLEDEAIALRRQAAEWGHSAGLPAFEQAISLEREADGYEYRIAWRESDLEYDLRPEHELAGTQVAFLSAMLDDIAETEQSLQARDELGAREAEATHRLIHSYRDEIAASLDTARARTSGDLQEHYTQAQTYLEQAVKAAQAAAKQSDRGEADAVRLTIVRAQERQGQLFAARARGLGMHARILDRLIDAGGALGDVSAFRRELDDVRAMEAEALEQARVHVTSARDELDAVKSRSSQVQIDAFKQGLANTLSALGAAAPAPPQARGPDDGGDRRRETPRESAPAAGGGFATPEALVSSLQGADPTEASRRMLELVHVSTPAAQRMVEMQRELIGPQQEFMAAMAEHFGETPEDLLSGMGVPAVGVGGDLRITDQTDDRATVEGGPAPIELVKIDGVWKIDGDGMLAGLGGPGMEQAEAVMGMMPRVLGDLADRVRAGEFGAPEQVMQAIMTELMGSMGAAGVPGK